MRFPAVFFGWAAFHVLMKAGVGYLEGRPTAHWPNARDDPPFEISASPRVLKRADQTLGLSLGWWR
jgi:hypothetical protein